MINQKPALELNGPLGKMPRPLRCTTRHSAMIMLWTQCPWFHHQTWATSPRSQWFHSTSISTLSGWRKKRQYLLSCHDSIMVIDNMNKVLMVKAKATYVMYSLMTKTGPGEHSAFWTTGRTEGERCWINTQDPYHWGDQVTLNDRKTPKNKTRVKRLWEKRSCWPQPSPPLTLPLSRSLDAGSLLALPQPYLAQILASLILEDKWPLFGPVSDLGGCFAT